MHTDYIFVITFTLAFALICIIHAADLSRLPAFKGLAIPKGDDGKIDPVRDLFRTDWPGVIAGPVVSQVQM